MIFSKSLYVAKEFRRQFKPLSYQFYAAGGQADVATSARRYSPSPPPLNMKLKVGLEVHAQLLSRQKLFSGSPIKFHAPVNTLVSFFDAAVPGTQPRLNPECVRLALRAAVALSSDVQPSMSFDRKHYMYPDQPAGYQVTQNFKPFAKGGHLTLLPRDLSHIPNSSSEPIDVRIKQLQIEQDTGKTTYSGTEALIDLNRTNTALIELVTEPDLPTAESAGVFVRKLQALLRHIAICTGDMETGAMRVDANVNIDQGPRCEIKNLFSPSAVIAAIKAEYQRQAALVKNNEAFQSETRGWNGKTTYSLRIKDVTVDYRYMPDPEIPEVIVPKEIVASTAAQLPKLPDSILDDLLADGAITWTLARTLFDSGMPNVRYYQRLLKEFEAHGGQNKSLVSTWFVYRWMSESEMHLPLETFRDLLILIDNGGLTTTSAKLVISHYAELLKQGDSEKLPDLKMLIAEFELNPVDDSNTLKPICQTVIDENEGVVKRIKNGKTKAIAVLVGLVLRSTQGTANPAEAKSQLERLLGITETKKP